MTPMSYTERVRGEDAPDLPIVVGLHFHGSDARITDLVLFTGFTGPCRLIFPHGAFPVGDGYSWYDGVFYDLADSAKCKVITAVAADLASLLEDLARHHPEAPKPIVVGASQGGDLAAAVAVLHPDTVGLAIPVAANWLTPVSSVFAPAATSPQTVASPPKGRRRTR